MGPLEESIGFGGLGFRGLGDLRGVQGLYRRV